jgi:hypothetical protein
MSGFSGCADFFAVLAHTVFMAMCRSLSQIVHRNGLRARLNGSGPHQEISIS